MRILRSIAAFLAGYLVSLLSSIVWFNNLTHRDPSTPQPLLYLAATALFAIVFAIIAGYIAAMVAGETAHTTARVIAFFVVAVSVFSWFETPGRSHWFQVVAVVLMAPAVVLGAALHARSAARTSPDAL